MVIRRKPNPVKKDRVYIGKLLKPHGLKGEMKFRPYGCPAGVLGRFSVLYCESSGMGLELETIRGTEETPILKFKSIDDRNASDRLCGETLWVYETDLPELEEGYLYESDILYASVETEDGIEIGQVEDIMETGARDVMVVRGEGQEWLLPITGEVILHTDKSKNRIVVKLLEYEEEQGVEAAPGKRNRPARPSSNTS